MNANRSISRRDFLAWTTVSAVAPFTADAASAASANRVAGSNEAIRIGVIGCGARGMDLMAKILARERNAPRAVVAAVCDVFDPRRQRAQDLAQAPAHRDWRQVIERKDVDAVIIATPNHWHAPMAIAAMQCGKDVYCETPMAHAISEARAFRDWAGRTRRVVQIGAERTSESQWHWANDIVRKGAIGKTVWSQGSYSRSGATKSRERQEDGIATPGTLDWEAFAGPSAKRAFDPQRFHHWRNYWDYSGGVATEVLYDKLAALLIATGAEVPERVSAAGGIYVQDGREVPDTFVMTAEYRGGHTIVLASSMANTHGIPAVIRGERAAIELHGDTVKILPEPGSASTVPILKGDTYTVPSRPDHLDDWLECMCTRERCVCDETLGYHATIAIAMAVEAYRTSRTLRFDETSDTVQPDVWRGVA